MAQYPLLEDEKLTQYQVIISFCVKAATNLDITVKDYQGLWKQGLKSQIFQTNSVAQLIDKL